MVDSKNKVVNRLLLTPLLTIDNSKINVLIVEDDAATRENFSLIMQEHGYNVFGAACGREALEKASNEFFNLVFIDLVLPDINGLEVLEKIIEINADSIGIMITGHASLQSAIESMNRGAYSYVVKPVNFDHIWVIVKNGLEKQRLSMENKQLFQKLQKNYLDTIAGLAKALEAKDPYTRGHSEKVAIFATSVAKELGFDQKQVEEIKIAALFHDIGKIGISDHVLQKEDILNDEELVLIQTHVTLSADIIKKIEFIRTIVPIVLYHHEHFNGEGYREGLSGEDIPFEARILAVCDAFSAMVSNRPYRNALKVNQAISELKKGAGTQFDPYVVEVFLRLIPTFK